MDELRAKRIAYFQNLQSSLTQIATVATTSKGVEKKQPEVTQIESNLVDTIVETRISTLVDSKLTPEIVFERKELNITKETIQKQEFSKLVIQSNMINANDDLDIIIIDPEEVKKDLERRRLKARKEEINLSLLKKKEELEQLLLTNSTKSASKSIKLVQQKPNSSKSQVNKIRIHSAIAIRITNVLEHKLVKVSEKKNTRRYKVLFEGSKQPW
jgi:hypothetical protein